MFLESIHNDIALKNYLAKKKIGTGKYAQISGEVSKWSNEADCRSVG